MPAGVSLKTYLKFTISATFSMFAGAQAVHHYYNPLEDLDEWVKKYENILKSTNSSKKPEPLNSQ